MPTQIKIFRTFVRKWKKLKYWIFYAMVFWENDGRMVYFVYHRLNCPLTISRSPDQCNPLQFSFGSPINQIYIFVIFRFTNIHPLHTAPSTVAPNSGCYWRLTEWNWHECPDDQHHAVHLTTRTAKFRSMATEQWQWRQWHYWQIKKNVVGSSGLRGSVK
jgi:hypothetical protein